MAAPVTRADALCAAQDAMNKLVAAAGVRCNYDTESKVGTVRAYSSGSGPTPPTYYDSLYV